MEKWKMIKDFSDYEISTKGNLRSFKKGKLKYLKKITPKKNWYPHYSISQNGNVKTFKVHILVGMAFLGYTPQKGTTTIDHIDDNKENCNLSNLRIITHRNNILKNKKPISKYNNVYKNRKKWRARVRIEKIDYRLGTYYTAEQAYKVVTDFLTSKNIENG